MEIVPIPDEAHRTMVQVGRRLRGARASQRLTLQDLAQRTGLRPCTLSMIERGKASPSVGSLMLIAETLKLSLHDLFLGAGDAGCEARLQPARVIRHASLPSSRVLSTNREQDATISYAEYAPGTEVDVSAQGGRHYGIVVHGKLTLVTDGRTVSLGEADVCQLDGKRVHSLGNSNANTESLAVLWLCLGSSAVAPPQA